MNRRREAENAELARIIARYKCQEDVDNAKDHLVTQDHYCWGCPWGIAMQDRFVCPFVDGSCARYPQTLSNPNMNGMDSMIEDYRARRIEAESQAKRDKAAAAERAEEEKQKRIAAIERKRNAEKKQEELKKHVEYVDARREKMKQIREDIARTEGIAHMMFDK